MSSLSPAEAGGAPRAVAIAEGSRSDPLSRLDRAAALYLGRRRVPAPSFERAVVSFTFDDVPDSAVAGGARILEAHGVAGTFYLAGGLCGKSFGPWRFFAREDVPRLLDGGHEIGCHTFSHPVVQQLGRSAVADELDRNRDWLAAVDARVRLTSFAYPYGAVGMLQKDTVARRFKSCRGVRHGLNAGSFDRAQLRAVQLYDHLLDEQSLKAVVAEAVRTKAWLVFYTHDVQDGPTEHGCSPRLLDRAVEAALAAGCDVRTADGAMTLVETDSEARPAAF